MSLLLPERIVDEPLVAGCAVDAEVLADLVASVARDRASWEPQVRHDPDTRWFTRLVDWPELEVWLIGWDAGQGLDLHDHGTSAGAFTVVQGCLREQVGTLDRRGRPRPSVARRLPQGAVRTFEPGAIHAVENASTAPATSIHAYSPPLGPLRIFDLPG